MMAVTNKSKLSQLSPSDIGPNDENPRIHFPQNELDDLAASIETQGILVPLSVYENPNKKKGQPKYIILDGERRWKCSTALGLEKVPCIVMPEPDEVDNLKTMFNIHMVRKEWLEMPTAWALKKLMDRTGIKEVKKLVTLTGVSAEQLKRLIFALGLSKKYQDYIDTNQVPLNFFYELDRNVIVPLSKQRPALLKQLTEKGIYASLVDKKIDNIITDTVDLRRMRPIIDAAAKEAGSPEKSSDLDDAIVDLINTKKRTIQETYENTVEMVVEADKFDKQCGQLTQRLQRLLDKAESREEKDAIKKSAQNLVNSLTKILNKR